MRRKYTTMQNRMLAVALAAASILSAAPRRATVVHGGAVRGPNGGVAARAGRTTVHADGSATHTSRMGAKRPNGATITSQGSSVRDASGNVTASRSTNATSANGSTYQGSTTYNNATGSVHTGTCRDAGGSVIPCPTRK